MAARNFLYSITLTNGLVQAVSFHSVDYADLPAFTGASKLLGRGAGAGGGDAQEITIGSGLTMTGTTLSASGGGSGTVTSVNLTAPAAGITVSGGPITTSGSITLALADDLAALEALSGTDTIYYRSGANTWTAVTIGSGLTFSGGTLSASGGGGSPGGSDTYVQFNDGGAFGGVAGFTFNKGTGNLSVGNLSVTSGDLSQTGGNVGFFGKTPSGQQSGGLSTASSSYGSTEQTMLQAAYDCLRTFGFLS
jgi:hypothetical protein